MRIILVSSQMNVEEVDCGSCCCCCCSSVRARRCFFRMAFSSVDLKTAKVMKMLRPSATATSRVVGIGVLSNSVEYVFMF